MNEIELLKKVLPGLHQGKDVFLGPGDDCAALDIGLDQLVLAAVDQVVGQVHYDRALASPAQIGAKLLKRNLSDIAAMGGIPTWALLALASNNPDEQWYLDFFAGIKAEAEKWNVSLCGGDIGSLPAGQQGEVASLTILGKVEKNRMCLRTNAEPGDFIFATGYFGNSYNSGHHLSFEPRINEGRFLSDGYTRAMIDISDGLLLDVQRVALASGVGIELWLDKIPLREGASPETAFSDGEDYELVFSVPAERADELEHKWDFPGTRLTRIGRVVDTYPGKVVDSNGINLTENVKKGYEHTSE
jgi:thiamine-monophosphate kinase